MPEFALKFIIQGFFCQGSLSNFVKYFTILFNKFYPSFIEFAFALYMLNVDI